MERSGLGRQSKNFGGFVDRVDEAAGSESANRSTSIPEPSEFTKCEQSILRRQLQASNSITAASYRRACPST